MEDPGAWAVTIEIIRWGLSLVALAVPFLVRWISSLGTRIHSLGTRVAVAENEIVYLKAEVAEDRKLLAGLPSDIKVIMAELKEIKRRLEAEERRSGAG